MPNHIYNKITIIHAEEAEIQKIRASVMNDKYGRGSIDFEKLIPMPEHIFKGNLGPDERAQYGKDNWYDWSVENWGTIWRAYGFEDLPRGNDNEIIFNTAWSSVPDIVSELSKRFPEIEFEYCWADEDFGSNTGRVALQGGKLTDAFLPGDRAKEAYELAGEITGHSMAEMNYRYDEKLDNYIFDKSMEIGGMQIE